MIPYKVFDLLVSRGRSQVNFDRVQRISPLTLRRRAAKLAYLPDVARIEWARTCAANAPPDDPGLDLKALARIDPEALEDLHLSLHVAARLVCSPSSAFDIWRPYQRAGPTKSSCTSILQ